MNKSSLEEIITDQEAFLKRQESTISYYTRSIAASGAELQDLLNKKYKAESIRDSAKKDLEEGKFDKDEI